PAQLRPSTLLASRVDVAGATVPHRPSALLASLIDVAGATTPPPCATGLLRSSTLRHRPPPLRPAPLSTPLPHWSPTLPASPIDLGLLLLPAQPPAYQEATSGGCDGCMLAAFKEAKEL
ncbi:unnamed protein product, partial [Urochloa humidicola]